MQRVIDGKKYDIDKATLVAEATASCYPNDFHYWEEKLFRTAKGAWFLHGEGGGLTRWSQQYGDGRGSGEDILAMSSEEALEWCENNRIEPEDIEKYFELEEA